MNVVEDSNFTLNKIKIETKSQVDKLVKKINNDMNLNKSLIARDMSYIYKNIASLTGDEDHSSGTFGSSNNIPNSNNSNIEAVTNLPLSNQPANSKLVQSSNSISNSNIKEKSGSLTVNRNPREKIVSPRPKSPAKSPERKSISSVSNIQKTSPPKLKNRSPTKPNNSGSHGKDKNISYTSKNIATPNKKITTTFPKSSQKPVSSALGNKPNTKGNNPGSILKSIINP